MSADSTHIHDILGVGIGPFGLGLAALSEPLDDVDAIFLDQRPEFRWHPGMMIEGSTIQVSFLADLVTMADPTSPYSFLNFLKERRRLYPFYIRESFYPLRAEFDEYCRWVAARLDSLRWNRRVVSVTHKDGIFTALAEVTDDAGDIVDTEIYRARHLVLGVGTQPVLPPALQGPDRAAVLRHERTHIRRGDTLTKPLFYALACLHWWNPLAWLAFRQFERAAEQACDEAAVRGATPAERTAYCESLLRFAVRGGRRAGRGCAAGAADAGRSAAGHGGHPLPRPDGGPGRNARPGGASRAGCGVRPRDRVRAAGRV